VPTPARTRATGSHFLPRASSWIRRLVDAARVRSGQVVLDAGAGAGSITQALAQAVAPGGTVVAVETDPDAVAALQRMALPNVQVVAGDMLAVRWPDALDAVAANPPFRLLPALLRRILAEGVPRAALVVPQELADRLTATPGSEAYGRLTVEVGVLAKCAVVDAIPRQAFDPPPEVACALLTVVRREGAQAPPGPEFAAVLDAAWGQRTRTLRHSLAPLAGDLGLAPQDVSAAIATCADRTAAQVSPWEFGEVARALARALVP